MKLVTKPIFVVDDNQLFVRMLRHRIVKEFPNYEVEEFLNPEEFLKNLEKDPALILIDYNFGSDSFSGLDLIIETKKVTPNINIAVLSGEIDEQIVQNCLNAGADRFFQKSGSVSSFDGLVPWIEDILAKKEDFWGQLNEWTKVLLPRFKK